MKGRIINGLKIIIATKFLKYALHIMPYPHKTFLATYLQKYSINILKTLER